MNQCSVCGAKMVDAYGGQLANCSDCGWTRQAAGTATSVKQAIDPNRDGTRFTGRSTEFRCPLCREQNLEVAMIATSQVCSCRNCHGFLVDSLSLSELIQDLRADYRGADDRPAPMDQAAMEQTVTCPTCRQTMYTHPYHGPGNAVINSCSICQLTWLDGGEFSSIVRAPGKR